MTISARLPPLIASWLGANPLIVGVSGCQGSGKTTLARTLKCALTERGLSTAILSLDDLYLTRWSRQQLARDVHPLFATRGVPGTHDVQLGLDVIQRLRNAKASTITAWPRFDKASDDRAPDNEVFVGRPDFILLEGWCVGVTPQHPAALLEPVNDLERTHDPSGVWRSLVNERIATDYAALFLQIDRLIFLRAPSSEVVPRWRMQQEETFRTACSAPDAHLFDEDSMACFVKHFERLTRHMLESTPAKADVVIELDENRRVSSFHVAPQARTQPVGLVL